MWRAITTDDVMASMNKIETDALRTKLLVSGQSDPLPQIISQVTLEVREAIRSCDRNRLSVDSSLLPEGAIYQAVALIRHRLLTRFDSGAIGESRLMEYRTARSYLSEVAACKRAVENPDDGEDAAAPLPDLEMLSHHERQATREKLSGL